LVYQRAGGCCEYCLIPEAVAFANHEIDHIIAQKHGGPTEADNLALSCVLCNKQLNHPNRFVEREWLLVTGILRVPN